MRTIDADELKKKLEAEHCDCEVIQIIDDMPTAAEAANAKAACMSKAHTIMEHYGAQHQLMKLCEECGELIQQAAKCYDRDQPFSADFIEELADVEVLIMQFRCIMGAYWFSELERTIDRKLDRQLQRIAEESEVHHDP